LFPQRFERAKKRVSAQARVEFGEKGSSVTTTLPKADGYVFAAPQENLIAQARLDGFTLSKMKPYDSWKTFCPQFVELWKRYISVARPAKITRIALRYVNVIEIPAGVDFKEYILTIPEIAPGIPQALPSFLMRLVVPSPAGTMAIITEATSDAQPSAPGLFPLIFDIDVFRDIEMEPDDPELWTTIRELRSYKNTIFFKSLTPKTLEMFE
jgi:uncharacterized protein (TIGR04255 family)